MERLRKLINKKIKYLEESNKTFKDIFEIVHNQEDRIFCEQTNGYKIIKTTYTECKNKSILMGKYFHYKFIDVPKGSYVGLMMENSLEWITIFWGLLMAGYKPMLLNVRLSSNLNQEIINMLNIEHVISDKINGFKCNELIVNDIDLFIHEKDNIEFDWENDIALSTSATTLNIKICVYKAHDLATQIMNSKSIINTNPMIKAHHKGSLKLLCFLPFYHIFGLVATYFWFSFFGRTFVFLKDYSSNTILRTVRKHKVTHIFAVPMLWHMIFREINHKVSSMSEKTQKKYDKGLKFSLFIQNIFPKFGQFIASKLFKSVQNELFGNSIKFLISGGSYISLDTLRTINGIGYPLFNGYGMSEIGITSVELRKRPKHRILGSIGKPFKYLDYKINDGKLFVKGESICSKIISNKGIENINHNEWFDTKDLARVDKDNYYYIDGREDDVVIGSNGEKINPDLIEKSLFLPDANRYSVLGIVEEGEVLLSLIVEIKENINQLKLCKLIEEIDNNLLFIKQQNYNIQKVYFTYDSIAADTAVKVSRCILLKLIYNKTVNLISYSKIKSVKDFDINEITLKVCDNVREIMAKILSIDVKDIGPESHFIFDLGGTSLDYFTLLFKLKEIYEIDFNFSEESSCLTAYELGKYIVEKKK